MPAFPPISLEVRDLACARGGQRVFAGLSFGVTAGKLLAVTGPNGAGKSSLLRLLAGLLRPESGLVRIVGGDSDAASHYLGHADALKAALSLRETLRFFAALYGQAPNVPAGGIEEAAGMVGLGHALDLPVAVLSAGQRRRAGLARLLVSPRPLWLLDEPTATLDKEGEVLVGRLVRGHLDSGGIVVAATHLDLPVDVDAMLDMGRDADRTA